MQTIINLAPRLTPGSLSKPLRLRPLANPSTSKRAIDRRRTALINHFYWLPSKKNNDGLPLFFGRSNTTKYQTFRTFIDALERLNGLMPEE